MLIAQSKVCLFLPSLPIIYLQLWKKTRPTWKMRSVNIVKMSKCWKRLYPHWKHKPPTTRKTSQRWKIKRIDSWLVFETRKINSTRRWTRFVKRCRHCVSSVGERNARSRCPARTKATPSGRIIHSNHRRIRCRTMWLSTNRKRNDSNARSRL